MKKRLAIFVLVLTVGQVGAEPEVAEPETSTNWPYWELTKAFYEQTKAWGGDLLTPDTNALVRVIRYCYDRAKEAGEDVPADLMDWAQQDIGRVGSWEYRVFELETKDAEAIESQLNILGAERWECFRIEGTRSGKRLYMKRAGRSYLRSIPYGDALKLITGESST
jgi:hypothetical protein